MGLLLDKQGLPLSYKLHPGNTNEKETLLPEIRNIKKRHDIDRIVVVADRGLNDSENMIMLSGLNLDRRNRDGYIYGQSIRGADAEFKAWVLKDDYITDVIEDDNGEQVVFKHKSRMYPRKVNVKREDLGLTKNGNTKIQKVTIDQKQMVYCSQKYANT